MLLAPYKTPKNTFYCRFCFLDYGGGNFDSSNISESETTIPSIFYPECRSGILCERRFTLAFFRFYFFFLAAWVSFDTSRLLYRFESHLSSKSFKLYFRSKLYYQPLTMPYRFLVLGEEA